MDIVKANNRQDSIFGSEKNDMQCDNLGFITSRDDAVKFKYGNRVYSLPSTSQDEEFAVKKM